MKNSARKDLSFRLSVLKSAEKIGIAKTADLFNLTRDTIYRWKKNYETTGITGLGNKSRKKQFHPRKIADDVRFAIHHLAAVEPDLTLQEIVSRLNLSCTLNTVSRILDEKLKTRNRKINSNRNSSFSSFYLNVEKIPVDDGMLPGYLFQIRELTTGISFYGFSQDNSPNAAGIFVDYFLSSLPSELNPGSLTFYTCKGRFYHARGEKESLLESVIFQKFGAQLLVSAEKLKIENELLNLFISNKTMETNQFYQHFVNLVTESNLALIRQPNDWQSRLLLMPPLLIDRHFSKISDICTQSGYWQKQLSIRIQPPLLLPNLFEVLAWWIGSKSGKRARYCCIRSFWRTLQSV